MEKYKNIKHAVAAAAATAVTAISFWIYSTKHIYIYTVYTIESIFYFRTDDHFVSRLMKQSQYMNEYITLVRSFIYAYIYSGIFIKYWIDRKDEAMDRVIEKKRTRGLERERTKTRI